MGAFVNYLTNPVANLKNTPTTIITADTHTLLVNGLVVCNKGANPMSFNLQKLRTQVNPVTIFYINQFKIAPYQTIDVIQEFGLQIFLQYNVISSISDSLMCYSNGYTQIFDCEISYSELTELP